MGSVVGIMARVSVLLLRFNLIWIVFWMGIGVTLLRS